VSFAARSVRRFVHGDPEKGRPALVWRLARNLIIAVAITSHLVGVAIVVALLLLVLPLPDEAGGRDGLIDENWIATIAYVAAAVPFGLWRGLAVARPVMRFLAQDRPPTEHERRLVLRLPLRLLGTQMLLWAGGVVLFGTLNATVAPMLGVEVAITVMLGGLATASIAYLLTQRLSRNAVARVLAHHPPRRREVPGVGVRALLAWALGTTVPVAGALVLALFALVVETDAKPLARATLVLCGIGIAVGLIAMLVFARSIADPLRRLRDAFAAVQAGDLDVEVPVFDATEVGYAAAGFNRMVEGLRERERLRDLFGRQVGEDVARRALEEGVTLGGEEREAAALFVDVVGSTTFAAERPPAEVVEALNAFFAIVVEATAEHGGLVNKFAGDAALCLFGAPLTQDDPAGCALAAARDMGRRLHDELDELEAAIGVSAGLVVAGNVGTPDRYEYTVIGDPVNEAARLTELAKERPGRVLASEGALSRARPEERERWRLLGETQLRGRTASTRLAEPIGAGSPGAT
jgi:adenylate cyclase